MTQSPPLIRIPIPFIRWPTLVRLSQQCASSDEMRPALDALSTLYHHGAFRFCLAFTTPLCAPPFVSTPPKDQSSVNVNTRSSLLIDRPIDTQSIVDHVRRYSQLTADVEGLTGTPARMEASIEALMQLTKAGERGMGRDAEQDDEEREEKEIVDDDDVVDDQAAIVHDEDDDGGGLFLSYRHQHGDSSTDFDEDDEEEFEEITLMDIDKAVDDEHARRPLPNVEIGPPLSLSPRLAAASNHHIPLDASAVVNMKAVSPPPPPPPPPSATTIAVSTQKKTPKKRQLVAVPPRISPPAATTIAASSPHKKTPKERQLPEVPPQASPPPSAITAAASSPHQKAPRKRRLAAVPPRVSPPPQPAGPSAASSPHLKTPRKRRLVAVPPRVPVEMNEVITEEVEHPISANAARSSTDASNMAISSDVTCHALATSFDESQALSVPAVVATTSVAVSSKQQVSMQSSPPSMKASLPVTVSSKEAVARKVSVHATKQPVTMQSSSALPRKTISVPVTVSSKKPSGIGSSSPSKNMSAPDTFSQPDQATMVALAEAKAFFDSDSDGDVPPAPPTRTVAALSAPLKRRKLATPRVRAKAVTASKKSSTPVAASSIPRQPVATTTTPAVASSPVDINQATMDALAAAKALFDDDDDDD